MVVPVRRAEAVRMLSVVTDPAIGAPAAGALRRVTALLAAVVLVVAVRGPMCDRATHAALSLPLAVVDVAVAGPASAADPHAPVSAPVVSVVCPMAGHLGDPAPDQRSCPQASSTAAVNASGAATMPADRDIGAAAAPTAVPPTPATAVLRHAATLHQLSVLRV
jgi:hypothetical protein